MIKQPERRPGPLAHRQLGFDFKEAIGLVVLAIGINSAVEEFTASVALRPNLQAAVRYRIVLGRVGCFVPDLVIPLGGIQCCAGKFIGKGHGERPSLTKRLWIDSRS